MSVPAPAAAPRPLARPARDLRLDIVRGWMQISIFGAHAVGSAFGTYGIHAAWGVSDSSGQFVFLSGFVLASVFLLKEHRRGAWDATTDMLRRAGRLWVVHLILFFMFGATVIWSEMALPLPGEIDRLAWRMLVDDPLHALPGAALLLYMPNYVDILPVFVLAMLLLPGFLLLAGRVGAWALLPSFAVWAGVQAGIWEYWSWLPTGLDPLAWQFVFLLGAWFGRRALLTGAAVAYRRWGVVLAAVVVAAGFAQRVAEGLGSPLALDEDTIWILAAKSHIGPFNLLHGLALAYLVAVLVPRDAAWMHRAGAQALAAVGRHSLNVFCIGILLSWAVTAGLRLLPPHWWVDPALTLAGAALLVGFALIAERRRAVTAPVTP